MEIRCRNDVDLEPKEPKFGNQCGLSQFDAIRASDIWRGRQTSLFLSRNSFYILVLNQYFALDFKWRFCYDIPIQYKGLHLP